VLISRSGSIVSFGALGMKILDPETSMTVIDEYDVGTSENVNVT